MKAVVTGASGHIGNNLVRLLIERGHDVTALVHDDDRALRSIEAPQVKGDVCDAASLRSAFEGADTVFHLAALITFATRRDDRAVAINVEGTRNVVAACTACGVKKLVHTSSIHAYNAHPRDEMVTEERGYSVEAPGFVPVYDRTKAAGSQIVEDAAANGLDATIVNPCAVIGPNDFIPSAMGSVLLDLYSGKMPALLTGGFSWVDVRDVCEGIVSAATRGRAGEKYLLSGHHLPIIELAKVVEACGGAPAPRIVMPRPLAYLGVPFSLAWAKMTNTPPRFTRVSVHALGHHQKISCAKAEKELGYTRRDIRDTVAETLEWFQEAGVIDAPKREADQDLTA